jgi:hypothetical protein
VRPMPGLLLTGLFLRFVGMEEEGEALCVTRFGGSSLFHLMTQGRYPRGMKRTKAGTIFCWIDNLLGGLLYGYSSTLLTAASRCAGSPALCLDKLIVGKAQRTGDRVCTHHSILHPPPFIAIANMALGSSHSPKCNTPDTSGHVKLSQM